MHSVALINMPMASAFRPSIQLGRLKSQLTAHQISVRVFDFNLEFSKLISHVIYDELSNQNDILLGHWLFADFVPELSKSVNDEAYLNSFSNRLGDVFKNLDFKKQLLKIKSMNVPQFMVATFGSTDWTKFSHVGFTCTFSQVTAALALSKKIKEANPSCKIIFGGSEVQSEMGAEVLKHCDWVDCCVQGEGESAIIEIVNSEKPVPRMYIGKKKLNLADLPHPDYDDFFERIDGENDPWLGANARIIPIEGSRGCWWGEKHHCKFCGLNGEDLRFRRTTADAVISEITSQSQRYERYEFEFVDNILDYKFFESLVPRIKAQGTDYLFFAETKANLKPLEVEGLSSAGFRTIQPGIESLSSRVLKIMDKGATARQNIELLRLARDRSMTVVWNVLYGFPGETNQDYQEMIELIPKLRHLEPPKSCAMIRIDRFSPYFRGIVDKKSAEFDDVRPALAYSLIYPPTWDYWKLAYFFEGVPKNSVEKSTYEKMLELVTTWRDDWSGPERPTLTFKKGFNHGHVVDRRHGAEVYKLEGVAFNVARLLEDGPSTVASLVSQLSDSEDVPGAIADMIQLDIIVEIDKVLVWLPNRTS